MDGGARDGRQGIRCRRDRGWSRRLCGGDPREPAWPQGRDRRARAHGRHLPQLGLHPDEGHAALGRGLSPDAPRQGLRAVGRGHRLRPRRRGETVARGGEAAQFRRRPPDEEEQGRGGDGQPPPSPPRARFRSRPTRAPKSLSRRTSSSPPARGRASCRGSRPTATSSGPTSTRWCRRGCRSASSSSARAPSASNSRASTTRSAPT